MNILQIRFYLFLFGCIGSRLFFTLVSYLASGWFLQMLGVMALFPAIAWFYIFFIGKRDTGLEVFGDTIWWKNLRPIHMLLWSFFAYLAISGNRMAYLILLVDTTFGLGSFLAFHYSEGNLNVMLE
jgi:hypothetical protein